MSVNHFDGIYYINLDHRTDRKKELINEVKKLGIQEEKLVRIPAHYYPLNGYIGCLLSHIDAIELAIQNNLENVLILEDDCYFYEDANFVNEYINYFFQVVDNFDVFLLGLKSFKAEQSQYPCIKRVFKSLNTHAYCINKHYMPILCDHFKQTYKLSKHLSSYNDIEFKTLALDRRWHLLQKKDNWYTGDIIIAGQTSSHSDIESYLNSRTIKNLNKDNL